MVIYAGAPILDRITFGHDTIIGGEGGIRTPGTVTRTSHFECDAIDQLCHLSARGNPVIVALP